MIRPTAEEWAQPTRGGWRLTVTYGGADGYTETRDIWPTSGKPWSFAGGNRRINQEWRNPPEGLWVEMTRLLRITH